MPPKKEKKEKVVKAKEVKKEKVVKAKEVKKEKVVEKEKVKKEKVVEKEKVKKEKVVKAKEVKKEKKPKEEKTSDNNIILDIVDSSEGVNLETNFKCDYREIINTYNPKNNKTSSKLSLYEATLIIGKRATQITYGADPVIDYKDTDTPEQIAINELLSKKIPFIIKRQVNNIIEYWKIDDMELDEEFITIY
jgi:DNA-directed RNA polymerase subunit K/omega